MKKSVVVIFLLVWVLSIVYTVRYIYIDTEPKRASIYHLQDLNNCTYYVYPNFVDEYHFIKYLFDFANSHKGTLIIVGNEEDVDFEDGVDFINDSKNESPYFFFSRLDSNSVKNKMIVVNVSEEYSLKFTIKKEVNKKELSGDFDSLNLNIVQNMLDYVDADSEKTVEENYTYELYNKYNDRKIIINFYGKGKWFEIEIL